ncbi:hypothetical protein B0H13DRAFT_2280997 [Mycena leptocephala]|nr:hypothetical protein B0H13DRAFT_2280997 [Mycena leptocephala]
MRPLARTPHRMVRNDVDVDVVGPPRVTFESDTIGGISVGGWGCELSRWNGSRKQDGGTGACAAKRLPVYICEEKRSRELEQTRRGTPNAMRKREDNKQFLFPVILRVEASSICIAFRRAVKWHIGPTFLAPRLFTSEESQSCTAFKTYALHTPAELRGNGTTNGLVCPRDQATYAGEGTRCDARNDVDADVVGPPSITYESDTIGGISVGIHVDSEIGV